MRVDLVDPQRQLLAEIADKRVTRDDVAITYAFAIRQQNEVDFPTVNRAIIDRWSMSALKYIKEKARRRLAFDDQWRCDGCETREAIVYSPPHAANFCADCARLNKVAFDEDRS